MTAVMVDTVSIESDGVVWLDPSYDTILDAPDVVWRLEQSILAIKGQRMLDAVSDIHDACYVVRIDLIPDTIDVVY